MNLSVVIPAYNEAARIGGTLEGLLSRLGPDCEVIVVADGTDGTAAIVERHGDARLRLLRFPERLGKGGAVRAGLEAARGDAVGFLDADGSVDAEQFGKLVRELDRCHAAVASRRLAESQVLGREPWPRRVSSRVFSWVVNALFGLGVRDTQCGAKVFRREPLRAVLPSLTCSGYEFDVELLWRIKAAGYSIREVPVLYRPVGGSKFRLWLGPTMVARLLRVRLLG